MRDDTRYFVTGDLREAMRQEDREEQAAAARDAFYDGIDETTDPETLREVREDHVDELDELSTEIQRLEHELTEKHTLADAAETRLAAIDQRLREVTPEITAEARVSHAEHPGNGVVTEIVDRPPTTGLDDNRLANHPGQPVTETVADALSSIASEIEDELEVEAHESGEVVAVIRFADYDDADPVVHRLHD